MTQFERRRDIDGLRAVAVLAVLAFHWGLPGVSGGFLGVDVFFVISGFLITSLIRNDLDAGTFTLIGFWERRIRRIAPALLVMMAVALAAGAYFLFAPDLRQLGAQAVTQSLFSSNFLFAAQSGYFDQESLSKPLLHTWSLAVEEQYYLLFPLLLIGLFSAASRRKSVWGLAAIFMLSYVACVWGSLYYPFETFYLLPFRAWELLLGALVTYAPQPRLSFFERQGIALVALLWLVASFFLFGDTTHVWATMALPCVATALLLWLGRGTKEETFAAKILGWTPAVGIGLISYSLYLWHWPIYVYATYANGGFEVSPIGLLAVAAGSFAVAALSWKFVETPIRTRQILSSSRRLFRAVGLTAGAILVAGFLLYGMDGMPQRFSVQVNRYAAAIDEMGSHRDQCYQLSPEQIRRQGPCLIGNKDLGPADFLAVGDSFADSLFPVLEEEAQGRGRSGLFASYNSCPPLRDIYRPDHQKSFDCRGFNQAVAESAQRAGVKRVLLIARWQEYADTYYLSDRSDSFPRQTEARRKLLRDKVLDTVSYWRNLGVEVWIVKAPPSYVLNIPRLLASQERTERGVPAGATLSEHRQENAFVEEVFAEAQKQGARLIDPADILCPEEGACLLASNGASLYRDSHHLSRDGAMLLRPLLTRFMD